MGSEDSKTRIVPGRRKIHERVQSECSCNR
nr:MAG TPA: hypothetical protein [Caudoviricetes sp.]